MEDVVIVGAGPAGLAAAAMLRAHQIDAILLERGRRIDRNPKPYRGKDVLVIGAGNSGTEIALDLAQGGAGRARIAIRTPPNILPRDMRGFPIQLIGIAVQRMPPRLLDPLFGVLRRAAIPDLSSHGLPLPSAPFSQFQSTATVPVFDVGFIDAVRNESIEVVPAVTALDGRAVVLADGSRVYPDTILAATGYRPGLEPLVGRVTSIGRHGIPGPQPRLHFLGIGIAISGFLYQVGKDSQRLTGEIATETGRSPRRHQRGLAQNPRRRDHHWQ